MMQIQCWTIRGGAFHFGQHGLGQEETRVHLPSDSLFAALVARLAILDGAQAVQDFVAPFLANDPPWVISSAFPFAGQVRFFPTPASALGGNTEIEAIIRKKLKKVSWISQGIFGELIQGKPLPEIYAGALKLQGGTVLVSQAERSSLPSDLRKDNARIWFRGRRPRVTIDRSAQNTTIYFTGLVHYAAECGLWFGLHWLAQAPSLRSTLDHLLYDLQFSGLGGERAVGFGACQIEQDSPLELPEAKKQPWVSLSRYAPREDELPALQDARAAYSFDVVGGWLDSPVRPGQRRRNANFLREGSVFGPLDREVPGQILDVHPSYAGNSNPVGHPVYRSGFALPIALVGGAS